MTADELIAWQKLNRRSEPPVTREIDARNEIKAAIRFYEKRGWDWMDVVGFLSARALGTLPDDIRLAYQRVTHRRRAHRVESK